MGFARDVRDLLRGEGAADDQHRTAAAQASDRLVVPAAAATEAIAGAVEGDERDEEHVGHDHGRRFGRVPRAEGSGDQLTVRHPAAEREDLPFGNRQRRREPGSGEAGEQRQRVDLGLQRRIGGDGRSGRKRDVGEDVGGEAGCRVRIARGGTRRFQRAAAEFGLRGEDVGVGHGIPGAAQ